MRRTEKFINLFNSKKTLFVFIFTIILINSFLYYYTENHKINLKQKRTDASGYSYNYAKHFLYFAYYLHYFPLATLDTNIVYTRRGAFNELKKSPKDLVMEYHHWSRLGENARIFAFFPNAIISLSPKNPSIKLFNVIFFIFSLISTIWGFWKIKKTFFGIILVLLINFTPFYIYSNFVEQNIFGLLGSAFFIIFGLNIYFIYEKCKFYKIAYSAFISAFIIGFLSQVRNEISIVLISLLLIYLLSSYIDFWKKISLVLIVLLTFIGTQKIVLKYFDYQFNKTYRLVDRLGGHVYNGKRIIGHKFWHPVFCGLGDFDKKYGYYWNDSVAYKYALPILNSKYNLNIKYSGKYWCDNYYDKDSLYYIKFDEIPQYEIIVKEKVLKDIKNDPFWYLTIFVKRIIRVFTQTIPFNFLGWIMLPLIFLIFKYKKWNELKILITSLTLSATPILIYSGKGATYNSVFGYFVILILLIILFDKAKTYK